MISAASQDSSDSHPQHSHILSTGQFNRSGLWFVSVPQFVSSIVLAILFHLHRAELTAQSPFWYFEWDDSAQNQFLQLLLLIRYKPRRPICHTPRSTHRIAHSIDATYIWFFRAPQVQSSNTIRDTLRPPILLSNKFIQYFPFHSDVRRTAP